MASRRTQRREATLARIRAERQAVVTGRTTVTPRTDPRRAKTFTPAPPPPPSTTGGGAGPIPFAQTRAGLTFAAQQREQSLTIERQNAEALARQQHRDDLVIQAAEQKFLDDQLKQRIAEERRIQAEERERTRQANISQLRIERQGTFAQLLKSGDQVRAAVFALGFGPENDAFDVRARSLGTTVQEIRGARGLKGTTQEAINRVLGRRVGTELVRPGVTIGREGITGLGPAIGAARAFVQGGADVQQLLTSAFGVGSLREGERPGISQARLAELIESVVPTGVL